jgi:hypothetical protein
MKTENIIYTCTNENDDEMKFILHPNEHLRLIWDFKKDFTVESLLKFIEVCNYKVVSSENVPRKTGNLKLVKK